MEHINYAKTQFENFLKKTFKSYNGKQEKSSFHKHYCKIFCNILGQFKKDKISKQKMFSRIQRTEALLPKDLMAMSLS